MTEHDDDLDYEDVPIVVLPDGVDLDDLEDDLASQGVYDVFAIPESILDEAEELRRELQKHRDRNDKDRIEKERALRAAELRRLRDLENELNAEIENELELEQRRVSIARMARAGAAITFGLLGVLVFVGWPYYQLSLASRPFHALHTALRSSGAIGLPLGIAGTGLMAASMVYLVRKQLVGYFGPRTLPGWLRFHVVTGLLGPALILFHAAFIPTSILGAVAFFGMFIVVSSGVAGRYLLMYVPKASDGGEVELEDLQGRLQVYRRKLIEFGVDAESIRDDVAVGNSRRNPWLITAVIRVVMGDRESRNELRELQERIRTQFGAGHEARTILILLRRLSRERQWFVRHREIRRLVGAWRFAHRWLAIVMWSGILFHIAVAVEYADLFGGGNR